VAELREALASGNLASNDLSAWRVREVADRAFWVTAVDPEPWLGDGEPDDATVTRARVDFGRAIVGSEDPASRR
jgi:hypothetical protein